MDPARMWGSGDYAAVADKISEVGEVCVERAGVQPGHEVLDVACGTGNATLPAARAGARVTGLDFSEELLAIARERAADAMLEVEWVEGDAQDMPFEDASFDRVLSTFGHMFAPDHEATAAEMKRVARGRITICCWTPEGNIGRMFRETDGPLAPLLWGTEEHVRGLLGDAEFERGEVEWTSPTVEAYADFMLESFGPLVAAGPPVREPYLRFLHAVNEADDGTMRFRGEYLIASI